MAGRFFPQQPLPTTRRSPFPSHVHSPVFFSPVSYACLATLRVDFFKGLSIQHLNLRNGYFRSLTCSASVAEVTRGNRISPTPLFMLRKFPDHDPLHEVSGVKVPRPASAFLVANPYSRKMPAAVSALLSRSVVLGAKCFDIVSYISTI